MGREKIALERPSATHAVYCLQPCADNPSSGCLCSIVSLLAHPYRCHRPGGCTGGNLLSSTFRLLALLRQHVPCWQLPSRALQLWPMLYLIPMACPHSIANMAQASSESKGIVTVSRGSLSRLLQVACSQPCQQMTRWTWHACHGTYNFGLVSLSFGLVSAGQTLKVLNACLAVWQCVCSIFINLSISSLSQHLPSPLRGL